MEEKMTHYACACENMEGYSEYFIEQIKKSIDSEVDPFTGESVLPGSETYSKYQVFVKEYDRKYKKLKKNTEHLVLDLGSATTDFTYEKEFPKVLENIVQAINRIKHDVLTPVVEHLGPQVIEASRSTESLVELLRQKELDNIQYQQIVSCLVRWHVLDDLQRELKPRILNPCSYYIPQLRRHSGRPKENFYELNDQINELFTIDRYKYLNDKKSNLITDETKKYDEVRSNILEIYRKIKEYERIKKLS